MPTVTLDSFFASTLMVLLVVSAMAAVSGLLSPHINNAFEDNNALRCESLSRYILLNKGEPENWGQDNQVIPERFGLAGTATGYSYELDIDKVTRLNSRNIHSMSYGEIFEMLKMSDLSFRLEVKPIFDTLVSLTRTMAAMNETVYEFDISTQRQGASLESNLSIYLIAQDYLESTSVSTRNGRHRLNITLQNDTGGPALLVAFAKALTHSRMVSFGVYPFAHNSEEPSPQGSFLTLSPLNYVLNASLLYPQIQLSEAHALSFNHSCEMTEEFNDGESATYTIPNLLDPSPTILVVNGLNSSVFFNEWVAYPQLPIQVGVDFAGSTTLTDVSAHTYQVIIGSAIYECTILLGDLRR